MAGNPVSDLLQGIERSVSAVNDLRNLLSCDCASRLGSVLANQSRSLSSSVVDLLLQSVAELSLGYLVLLSQRTQSADAAGNEVVNVVLYSLSSCDLLVGYASLNRGNGRLDDSLPCRTVVNLTKAGRQNVQNALCRGGLTLRYKAYRLGVQVLAEVYLMGISGQIECLLTNGRFTFLPQNTSLVAIVFSSFLAALSGHHDVKSVKILEKDARERPNLLY